MRSHPAACSTHSQQARCIPQNVALPAVLPTYQMQCACCNIVQCPAQIVKSHLWSIYPPEPLTAEEAVLEQQQEAAEAARKVGAACAGSSLIAHHTSCETAVGMGPCSGCSGPTRCRIHLLHSSSGTELSLPSAITAPVKGAGQQAQHFRTSKRAAEVFHACADSTRDDTHALWPQCDSFDINTG